MEVLGYELLAPLSSREVYEARDPRGKACVVALVLPPPEQETTSYQRRLAVLTTWRHAHVVAVLDVQEVGDGRLLIAYEALTGTSLGTILAARGELSGPEVAQVWDGIGSALAALHERGIVHGDLSPENIMVTQDGRPVLIDVCASPAREAGTDGFQAPERRAGRGASAAADVYALAAVLRELSSSEALTAILADCFDSDPDNRPHPRDVVARRCQFASPEPVALPSGPSLAAARIRRRLPATEMKAPARERHRSMPWRLPVIAGVIALVMVGGTLLGRTLATPQAAGHIAGVQLTVTEPEDSAADQLNALLTARDAALMSRDDDLLLQVYTTDSQALSQDRQTLTQWRAAGIEISDLTTRIVSVSSSDDAIRAEIVVQPYERRTGRQIERIAQSDPTCREFRLQQDKIHAIAPCETGPQDDPAGP